MEDGTGPPAFEFRSCFTLLQGEKPLVKLATRTGAGSTLVTWAYDGLIGKPDVGGSWLAKESCLVLNWLMLVLAKANLALSSSDYMLEIELISVCFNFTNSSTALSFVVITSLLSESSRDSFLSFVILFRYSYLNFFGSERVSSMLLSADNGRFDLLSG
jgi:hypothetical protein